MKKRAFGQRRSLLPKWWNPRYFMALAKGTTAMQSASGLIRSKVEW